MQPGRTVMLAYGITAYTIFFGTFLYLIGFVGSGIVPKTIDSGTPGAPATAVAINTLLLALFVIQHTIMARIAFKRWWIRIIPEPAERSTFVLATSLLLILLVWQWRPLPEIVWQAEGALRLALYAISGLGWGIVLLSTVLIDHFDLFGVKQTFFHATGRSYAGPEFREVLLYKVCRHPLMLGFLIAFWATPTMTVGHLVFASLSTLYILVALQIEERTLIELHGEAYEDYRRRVRMLLPIPR